MCKWVAVSHFSDRRAGECAARRGILDLTGAAGVVVEGEREGKGEGREWRGSRGPARKV